MTLSTERPRLMAEATYTLLDGSKQTFQYDRLAPCVHCGLPVIEASVGGTGVCPWCDTGYNRYGDQIVTPHKATQDEYDRFVDNMLHRCVQCGAKIIGGHQWPNGWTSCSDCYGADFG